MRKYLIAGTIVYVLNYILVGCAHAFFADDLRRIFDPWSWLR